MLSKWLLVSLLALGVQNISAANFFVKYNIDVTKYNMVFYDPNTRLGLKGVLEKFRRDPFLPAIGFRGIKCNCEGFSCGCCSGINITAPFSIDRRACTNITYNPEDFAIKGTLAINEREILSTGSLSAKNPPPVCVPFPSAPFISFCVRFFDVYMSGKNLHTCVDLETHVVAWPVLILHFDCVNIGADGVSWMKPEDSNVPQTAQLAMLMSEVNGPEIYDHVDFEPDSVALPNNLTSTLTPEQENNIGQLKL